jgi:hypothetical protein
VGTDSTLSRSLTVSSGAEESVESSRSHTNTVGKSRSRIIVVGTGRVVCRADVVEFEKFDEVDPKSPLPGSSSDGAIKA